jgi:hypothetical protein
MALRAKYGYQAAVRILPVAVVFVAACASAPPPPDWQLNAAQSLQIFEQYYLAGDARADAEFARARSELARTGREDIVARAELVRCAVRTASLEFDECPGFEALRAGARGEELAYADYLSGRGRRPAGPDALSRLVAAGVQLKSGGGAPALIEEAVEIASAQGWRRPLLAWLGVLEKRARESGDEQAAARVRRRIDLISG